MTEEIKRNPLIVPEWQESMANQMSKENYEAAAEKMAREMNFDSVYYRPALKKRDAIADFKNLWMTGKKNG